MNRWLLVVILSFAGCQDKDMTSASKIRKMIEAGTDSTYKREYFPNPDKSLYAVIAKYYNASIKTFFYYYDIDKKAIHEIKTFTLNNRYGHYFEFYNNGNLKRYCYYVGVEDNSSYIKQYSINGILEDEKGNPFVDYIKNDKKELELHFSTVFFDSLDVELSSKNIQPQKINLQKSTMLPMLSESIIPLADSTIFLKIVGYKSMQPTVYNDTLRIKSAE